MSHEAQLNFKEDGPIVLTGEVEIINNEGNVIKTQGQTSFCRCGASENKPFCDGSHIKIGFKALAGLGKS